MSLPQGSQSLMYLVRRIAPSPLDLAHDMLNWSPKQIRIDDDFLACVRCTACRRCQTLSTNSGESARRAQRLAINLNLIAKCARGAQIYAYTGNTGIAGGGAGRRCRRGLAPESSRWRGACARNRHRRLPAPGRVPGAGVAAGKHDNWSVRAQRNCCIKINRVDICLTTRGNIFCLIECSQWFRSRRDRRRPRNGADSSP